MLMTVFMFKEIIIFAICGSWFCCWNE